MLNSIWQLLANYGLDTQEIADAIHTLVEPLAWDEAGNPTEWGGTLAPLIDFPVIGPILQGFASFAPAVTTATETIA